MHEVFRSIGYLFVGAMLPRIGIRRSFCIKELKKGSEIMDADPKISNNASLEDLREELVFLMRRFHKVHMGPVGHNATVSISEMQVLFAIGRAHCLDIRPRPSVIAKKLRVSPSAISQTLKALEDKQLVNRVREEGNSRSFAVMLTDQGKELVSHACDQRKQFFDDMFAAVGIEDVHELVRVMRKMVEFCENEQTHALCEKERLYNACPETSSFGGVSSAKGDIPCA